MPGRVSKPVEHYAPAPIAPQNPRGKKPKKVAAKKTTKKVKNLGLNNVLFEAGY
jgi:hypothetical protein